MMSIEWRMQWLLSDYSSLMSHHSSLFIHYSLVNSLLHLFKENPHLAVIISLCISVLIAILGVVPSVFVTAANILFFGFWNGTLISFLGESIGAGIAFILYRKGFKKTITKGLDKYPRINKLINAGNKEAFYLVFSLRLIPFVPSGLITFAAAIGKVSLPVFFVASSLGKLPALLMEAWSVYEVTEFGWIGKIILAVIALGLIYWAIKK
ncbi:MAG: VTT domain-containing protein, partial [Ferruginibacter sp.]